VQLSSGVVSDALRQLAEDGLVNQDDTGRIFVPTPTERDVLETYTARGLIGSAIVRRLASRARVLPEVVDDVFKELVWYAGKHDVLVTGSLDLDLQDALARAAEMSRIEAMFVRLTLQLRLFVTLMGLNYQYPVDEIVTDDTRILETIRDNDPDAAVAAWRGKIDNCVRYMVLHLDGRPRR
jgi:DNA-binding GntR family transcriptional regulator